MPQPFQRLVFNLVRGSVLGSDVGVRPHIQLFRVSRALSAPLKFKNSYELNSNLNFDPKHPIMYAPPRQTRYSNMPVHIFTSHSLQQMRTSQPIKMLASKIPALTAMASSYHTINTAYHRYFSTQATPSDPLSPSNNVKTPPPQRRSLYVQNTLTLTSFDTDNLTFDENGIPLTYIHPDTQNDEEMLAIHEEIGETIETKISLAIRADGGDIHFLTWDPTTQIVDIALSGTCESCDKSTVTLQVVVANALKFYFPQHVVKVRRVYLPGQSPH